MFSRRNGYDNKFTHCGKVGNGTFSRNARGRCIPPSIPARLDRLLSLPLSEPLEKAAAGR